MTDSALFPVPSGKTPITVKLINPVNAGPAILNRFMAPPVSGLDAFTSFPSLCFLLEHPSGRKLVWDLGIRKDYMNYAPKIAEYIPTTKYRIDVEQNVVDILEEHGVRSKDIEAVIWRYDLGSPSTLSRWSELIDNEATGTGITSVTHPPSHPQRV